MHHSRLLSTQPIPGTEEIQQDLLAAPFPGFVRTIADLLTAVGYQNVRLAKPMHNRGRNAHGGLDLMGTIPADAGKPLVIVQTKQYHRPVPRSFVDELRGTMVRLSASQGVLITTSTFSQAAQHAARAGQHIAPIRLIDGRELAAWLQAFNVPTARQPLHGVRSSQPVDPAPKLPVTRGAVPVLETTGRLTPPKAQLTAAAPFETCIEVSLDVTVRTVPREDTIGLAKRTPRKRTR